MQLEFNSLEPIQVPVKIDKTTYILQEASEDTATKFRTMATKGATMQDGKLSFGAGLGDMEPFLISRCLWEVNEDGSLRRQVPEQIVRTWPSRICKPIFETAKEISGLNESDTPERKALLALLAQPMSDIGSFFQETEKGTDSLGQFRALVQHHLQLDEKLYAPLWRLVEPSKEDKVKNS